MTKVKFDKAYLAGTLGAFAIFLACLFALIYVDIFQPLALLAATADKGEAVLRLFAGPMNAALGAPALSVALISASGVVFFKAKRVRGHRMLVRSRLAEIYSQPE